MTQKEVLTRLASEIKRMKAALPTFNLSGGKTRFTSMNDQREYDAIRHAYKIVNTLTAKEWADLERRIEAKTENQKDLF